MTEAKTLPFMLDPNNSLTVVFEEDDGGIKTITAGQDGFAKAIEALKAKDFDLLLSIMTPEKHIESFTAGGLKVEDGVVTFNGRAIDDYMAKKLMQFMEEDLPWEHLAKFIENLMANPSFRARKELYKFLETEDLPITEDGHFLAYKSVRAGSMLDWHSNSFDNSIGNVLEMPREDVDDNHQNGCSVGFHAGSLSYVRGFYSYGSAHVIVKINPADVVSVPSEDVRKLRTCRYEVLKEFDGELLKKLYSASGDGSNARSQWSASTTTAHNYDYDDEEEDDDDDDWDYETDEGDAFDPWDDHYM